VITITDGINTRVIENKDIDILESEIFDVFVWLCDVIDSRYSHAIDNIVLDYTNLNPKKLTLQEKLSSIAGKSFVKIKDK
jgi:hypothetical protein